MGKEMEAVSEIAKLINEIIDKRSIALVITVGSVIVCIGAKKDMVFLDAIPSIWLGINSVVGIFAFLLFIFYSYNIFKKSKREDEMKNEILSYLEDLNDDEAKILENAKQRIFQFHPEKSEENALVTLKAKGILQDAKCSCLQVRDFVWKHLQRKSKKTIDNQRSPLARLTSLSSRTGSSPSRG